MLKLTIAPHAGRWPRAAARLAEEKTAALIACVVIDEGGVVRLLDIAHAEGAEGTARFVANCEQGHWAREESSPLLAQALDHADWPAAFAALRQAARPATSRRVRDGRMRCIITGVEEGGSQ